MIADKIISPFTCISYWLVLYDTLCSWKGAEKLLKFFGLYTFTLLSEIRADRESAGMQSAHSRGSPPAAAACWSAWISECTVYSSLQPVSERWNRISTSQHRVLLNTDHARTRYSIAPPPRQLTGGGRISLLQRTCHIALSPAHTAGIHSPA